MNRIPSFYLSFGSLDTDWTGHDKAGGCGEVDHEMLLVRRCTGVICPSSNTSAVLVDTYETRFVIII